LVESYLARIRAYDKTGPALNAVQTVNTRAVEQADRLDATFKVSGPVGRLHCVPILMKDQIDTSDLPTTHGFAGFKAFVPQSDATVVSRLKSAGAIVIGKATMGEFASGYISSASGPIRNAYDPRRSPSGSSGGTGSGVAASFATVGVGEDTGGSVRGPAAVNSLVGLRPTLPLVSRHGMSPARPSTDTIGPLARTVRDAAILFDLMVGYDPNDPITALGVRQPPESYTLSLKDDGLRGARIGVIRQPMNANTNPGAEDYRGVRAVIDRALALMRERGAEVVDDVTIPDVIERLSRTYDANVFETERAMNRYLASHSNAPYKTLREILLSGLVVPARARTLMDAVGKSPDDPGYAQMLRAQEDTRQVVFALMADRRVDVLVYSTFDHLPGIIADDVMTRAVLPDTAGLGNNRRLSPVLGFPALAVPAGFIGELPVGIEFMGRPFSEPELFKLGYAFEQAGRHRRPPPLTPAGTPQ
jgi:Asp-tRNA(Asn)/Glu-tRNA(Gln) amidotransferase A subunit family amidase